MLKLPKYRLESEAREQRMTTLSKLARSDLRKLAPGQSVSERGITYTRLDGDGRWSVNVMVARVRHHVVVGLESQGYTRTQAEELIATLRAKKAERRHGIATRKASPVTFKVAAALYLDFLRETGGKDTAKKAQRLNLHLVPHLGGLTLASITESDLRRYCTRRTGEGASPATINRELAVVSHLFRTASGRQKMDLIPAPPCTIERMTEPESAPVYLDPDQARALLDAAKLDPNEHVFAFCMVGLHTGMRRDSILRLRIDDLDLARRVLWIEKDKAGERQQPMTAELAQFLRDYLRESVPDGSEWLFPSPKSRTGHAVNVYKAFRRVVKAAGLRKIITPHKMRHTMATNAAHAGVDAPTLQALGGWKSRRMVEKYTHAGTLTDAMDKLQNAYSARKVTQKLQRRIRKTS